MSEWIKRLAARYAEVNESKFLIPEEIPTAERTAFMGAAAAAHKAGQTHFNFGGKKHKVTMKTDTARAIADDVKEAKVDEISVGKLIRYGKAAVKDTEAKRDVVRKAMSSTAKQSDFEKAQKAVKGLGKRARGSDMYVDKMTNRSKVKLTPESDEVVMNPKNKKDKNASQETMTAEAKINELKKSTLGSYIKKAGPDAVKQTAKAARHDAAGIDADKDADMYSHFAKSQRAMDKASNRSKYIGKAVDKLTGKARVSAKESYSEQVELGEGNMASAVPPVYARILESREAHYKKASKPEDWDEKEKNNKGAMDMKADHKGETIDNPEAGDQMAKATNAAPSAKARSGDNKAGDKKIIPSATPTKGM